jgi:hypothetical protein
MKKTARVANLFIVFVLILTAAGLSGQNPVFAQAEDDIESQAADVMPEPTMVFDGMIRDLGLFPSPGVHPNDQFAPGAVPDVSGAPGYLSYVQAVNNRIEIQSKDGNTFSISDLSNFWDTYSVHPTGTACDADVNNQHHIGQPNVLFDWGSGRFILADVAYEAANIDSGPYFICVITWEENPTLYTPLPGTVYSYAIQTNIGIPHYYPDGPKMGVWQDGVYLATDMVDIENNGLVRTPRGVKVWALNKTDLMSGASPLRFKEHYLSEQMGFHYLVPSNYNGLPPAADKSNYFAAIQPGKFHLWEFDVDWNSGTSTFGNNLNPSFSINTDTDSIWATGSIIPQKVDPTNPAGISERVDVHGERLGSPLQYSGVDGDALWVTHPVESNSAVGLRWYEIRFDQGSGEPYFYQKGTYAPDDDYRWNGSLAVDGAGNMALGYNVSTDKTDPTETFFPEIRYTGRLKTDQSGTLDQGERVFRKGLFPSYSGSQFDDDFIDDGPWGRQSHMSVDPLDDCVFWYTNMYYDLDPLFSGFRWRTAIGWFSFPQCGAGQTKRVSLSTQDVEGDKASGLDLELYSIAISDTGRYVVFSSEATNLVGDDTNPGHRDVFLRDRDTDEDGLYDEPGEVMTTRISMAYDGVGQANGDSWEVSISGLWDYDLNEDGKISEDEEDIDGRYIAFSSDADNLVDPVLYPDTNTARDVFVYDRLENEIEERTILASAKDGTEMDEGNGASDQPFLNRSGEFVVFRSKATDLIPSRVDTNGPVTDIFLRVVEQEDLFDPYQTEIISVDAAWVQGPEDSVLPTISDDGIKVAFASGNDFGSANPNGDVLDVFVRIRETAFPPDTIPITSFLAGATDRSSQPYISGNGMFVAYQSRNSALPWLFGPPVYDQIYVAEVLAPDPPVPVSVNFFGDRAIGNSYMPAISTDGRYIVFATDANNLDVHLQDTNNMRDIYLHDRTRFALIGLTRRISLDYAGGQPNGPSFAPVIARKGEHIAYVSAATDLVTNDNNNVLDVFAFDRRRVIPTFLSIPTNVSGGVGDIKSVPVVFKDGQNIDTTVFSIDFDELCLSFDPGMTDAVTFNLPSDFITTWTYDGTDTDGEIDISIYDQIPPRTAIPNGTIVRIKLTIKSACMPAPGSVNNARVGFSSDPMASFGSIGQSIPGYASDGFVRILSGKLGDCNGDGLVDAGDLSALVLEFFDGDDVHPANTPGGTFPGNPIGCNPNQDNVVDAGDLSCTVLIIYGGGSAACTGTSLLNSYQFANLVTLEIPDSFLASPGQHVSLPIFFEPNGRDVSSAVFSIDFDHSWLTFDGADSNQDGLPDAIHFNLPEGFVASASYEAQDEDGEIDVVIYYPGLVQASLPAGNIMTVTLETGRPQGNFIAEVKSSLDPRASFGSPTGVSLPGTLVDGSIWIFKNLRRMFLPVTLDTK